MPTYHPTPASRLTLAPAIHGYAVAGPSAALAMMAALQLSDLTRPGTHPERGSHRVVDLGGALEVMPVVLVLVAIRALPGLAIVAAAARLLSWTGWLPFTLGGALTGALALTALVLLIDAKPSPPDARTLLGFVMTGMVGGLAFWWAALRIRPQQRASSRTAPSS